MSTEFIWGIQLVVGGVFLVAAIAKAQQPRAFVDAISDFQILPSFLAPPVAFMVLALEFGVAASHLAGIAIVAGVAGGLVATIVFSAAVIKVLRRGENVSCGCFGGKDQVTPRSLLRLSLMFVGEIVLLWSYTSSRSMSYFDYAVPPEPEGIAMTLIWASGVAAVGMWALMAPEFASVSISAFEGSRWGKLLRRKPYGV